jgi:cephalosporin-C deacetylase-like acetyl esterase
VFIPVISRTYCDPKSFAWNFEFKSFIKSTSNDRFGLKITLPNGNIANRVLPVRIHDLDSNDIKLYESELRGVLRGIDFIFRSQGVNRPLRSKEDNPHDNLNHSIYRDQINKTALAVREIVEGMSSLTNPELTQKDEIPVAENYTSKDSAPVTPVPKSKEVKKLKIKGSRFRPEFVKELNLNNRKRKWIAGAASIIMLIAISSLIINYRSKKRWAKEIALPKIEQLVNELNFPEAFQLVQKSKKFIQSDPKFNELATLVTTKLTILTDPPGVDVFIREYSDLNGAWEKIGRTPIPNMTLPGFSFYQVKFTKSEYIDVYAIAATGIGIRKASDTLSRKLFRQGTISQGMVYVEGYWDKVSRTFLKGNYGFFMDKYEVTNKQFKEFIEQGGYANQKFWKEEFIKNGKKLSWEQAMAVFTDQTGRPGPATWEAGSYPDGQGEYPVTGVSWYEAAAYSEFAGKSLPTGDHWDNGAGFFNGNIANNFSQKILPLSNFTGSGAEQVGKNPGISCYGTYDMAGNVREWCWNKTQGGRIVRGGGWDDPTYLYLQWSQLPPFDRSAKNGFRCVKYAAKDSVPPSSTQPVEFSEGRDFYKEKPVPDDVFRMFKNQFKYDSIPLDQVVEQQDSSSDDWIVERISFNAAYNNEREIAYLFLPRNIPPPYQTLILFPGANAILEKGPLNVRDAKFIMDFLVKTGRAVLYPIYKGTYERKDGMTFALRRSSQSHIYTEWLIKWVKDFSRAVDYLETRPDINTAKLGYYGASWGGALGGIIPAVEDRLKVSVLIIGGFHPWNSAFPEADVRNYVPRVKIPVLMLNGKYDMIFPYEKAVKPFFDLLGTNEKDKRLYVYETDHFVPKSEMIKETLNWLDKYLGPVK